MITYYVLRHVRTGKFMPESKTGSGYSFWSPEVPDSFNQARLTPRLFPDEATARRARSQWASGIRKRHDKHTTDGLFGIPEIVTVLTLEKCGRLASDLEIERVALTTL